MRKLWMKTAAAVLSVGMLAGCGQAAAPAASSAQSSEKTTAAAGSSAAAQNGKKEETTAAGSDEKFTLRISTTGETDDGLDIAMEMFKKKYPNCTFDIVTSPFDDLRDKQLMMLSMGDVPDIGKMKDWHKEFYKDGLVIDMGKYVDEWGLKDTLTDAQMKRMQDNGVTSAITFNNNTTLALYNKKILKQLGVEAPKTFDELEALGQKIVDQKLTTDDGKQIFATYVPTGIWGEGSWLWSLGGDYMNEDYTKCTLDSPESIAAHKKMQEYVQKGYSPVPDGTQTQMWLNGQLAVYFAGEWSQAATDDAKMDYGFMTVPTGKDGVGWSSLGGCNWAVFKDAKNQEKALEFLKTMYSDEFQIAADRGVTNLKIYDNPDKIAKWQSNGVLEAKKAQQEQLKHTKYNFMESCYKYPDGVKIYTDALERILVNNEDPASVLKSASEQITQGIAQNNK